MELYSSRYIETNSMIFDLLPFLPHLSKEKRIQLSNYVSNYIETKIVDETRKARAIINSHKLKVVAGIEYKMGDIGAMYREYSKYLMMDGKPEKGERKLADDLVLLINELF
jgi:hypothetical protein